MSTEKWTFHSNRMAEPINIFFCHRIDSCSRMLQKSRQKTSSGKFQPFIQHGRCQTKTQLNCSLNTTSRAMPKEDKTKCTGCIQLSFSSFGFTRSIERPTLNLSSAPLDSAGVANRFKVCKKLSIMSTIHCTTIQKRLVISGLVHVQERRQVVPTNGNPRDPFLFISLVVWQELLVFFFEEKETSEELERHVALLLQQKTWNENEKF